MNEDLDAIAMMALLTQMRNQNQESLLPLHMQEIMYRGRQAEATGGVGGYYEDPEETSMSRTLPPAKGIVRKVVPPTEGVPGQAVRAFSSAARTRIPKKKK